MSRDKQIEEMRDFMLAKSNSANVEPVFTTSDGKEIVLGQDLTKLLDDILEQAFIPFLAESLYNAGYHKQEWISVDEKLPSKSGKYICCTTKGTILIERFYQLDDGGWFINHNFCTITHWMPLPEAPKMKGGAE